MQLLHAFIRRGPRMSRTANFGKVLELADTLSLDEKETLLEVLRQRTIQDRRAQFAREIVESREEHRKGRTKAVSVADLMREVPACWRSKAVGRYFGDVDRT